MLTAVMFDVISEMLYAYGRTDAILLSGFYVELSEGDRAYFQEDSVFSPCGEYYHITMSVKGNLPRSTTNEYEESELDPNLKRIPIYYLTYRQWTIFGGSVRSVFDSVVFHSEDDARDLVSLLPVDKFMDRACR
ncbi:MAG TPA: hypothetical protein PKA63_01875 [Oligoflexia bacterium]|nr:hypothetical protein [Oligoflexia bacterium]HMP47398.1 hypothetical protein [Oligoflexia bacterium]